MALPLLGALAAISLIGGQLQNTISLYPPLWNAYQKWALSTWPNVNPTVAELIGLRYKGEIDEAAYTTRCTEAGIGPEWSGRLWNAAHNLLTAADYISLWRRDIITEAECDEKLRKLQLSDNDIALAKRTTEFVPSPSDIVRFAVREAYSPEIAAKFGQYQDIPDQYLSEAKKAGLPENVAKQFWAAHWELPSPSMGYEMYQRRIIDKPTLEMLLRSLDVMPFWRDKLIQLSYNPITRVDVRRMYATGVITEDEVYNAYLDIGYSPENAKRLQTFTTMDNTNEVENPTLSAVKKAFSDNLITIEQFKQYLKDLNYTDPVIDFWVAMVQYDKHQSEIDDLVKEVKAQYKNTLITIDEARKMLEGADLPASYINHQLTLMLKVQSSRVKLPTRSDLTDWLRLQMINEQQFIERMLKLGYSREDTELYLTEIAKTVDVSKVSYMQQATYDKWFKMGLLTEQRYRFVLGQMHKRQEDVELAVQAVKQSMTNKEV